MNMEIAVIMTCFNRCQKTIRCLNSLYEARDRYNTTHNDELHITVFVTDDSCTDGTREEVLLRFKKEDIHIIPGDGHCYWAGGMLMAWKKALTNNEHWHFFLLLNDDTYVWSVVFDKLLETHKYSLATYGKPGIYSGITCDKYRNNIITYGGDVFLSKAKAKWRRVKPTGIPQEVDQANANILLIDSSVVKKIGIFHKGYIHGCADYDYTIQAKRHGVPVLVTAEICGFCEYDHLSDGEVLKRLRTMSLKERRQYLNSPTHSDNDYLLFVKRNIPRKYYISYVMRKLRLYFPWLYLYLCKVRRVDGY